MSAINVWLIVGEERIVDDKDVDRMCASLTLIENKLEDLKQNVGRRDRSRPLKIKQLQEEVGRLRIIVARIHHNGG